MSINKLTSSPAHQLTSSPTHQLTSSPAHQLTSSPAHQLTSSGEFFLGIVVAITSLVGCTSQSPTGHIQSVGADASSNLIASSPVSVNNSEVIDIGVMIGQRVGYLCWPVDRLGIEPTDEIVAITSSCDCIQPSVVSYHRSASKLGKAFLLEYKPEISETIKPQRAPVSLKVLISFKLASGIQRQFALKMLELEGGELIEL